MIDQERIKDLMERISSGSPAPGGGSVAALSGSLGASLVSMVCRLSIGKKKYKDHEDELKSVLGEADALRDKLLALSQEDVEAFNEVVAAHKAAKDKEEGNERIQAAYKGAAEVPLKVAKTCLRVMELAQITLLKGNNNAITDSGVGALMAYSGLRGAIFNVKVNLNCIEDTNFISEMSGDLGLLEGEAQNLFNSVIDTIEKQLNQ